GCPPRWPPPRRGPPARVPAALRDRSPLHPSLALLAEPPQVLDVVLVPRTIHLRLHPDQRVERHDRNAQSRRHLRHEGCLQSRCAGEPLFAGRSTVVSRLMSLVIEVTSTFRRSCHSRRLESFIRESGLFGGWTLRLKIS